MDWSRLGEMLKQAGLIDEARWRSVLTDHERWGGNVPRLLIERRIVDEVSMVQVLSRMYGIRYVNLDDWNVPREVIDLVPRSMAEQHHVAPFRLEGNFLDVAMADPTKHAAIDMLCAHTQRNVRPYLTGPHMLDRAFARHYGRVTVGGYEVDPRVTSGTFLRGDVIDFDAVSGRAKAAPARETTEADGRVLALEQRITDQDHRIALLESLLKRDEDVLRRLFGLLVDKGIATRDELLELLR